MVFDPDIHDNRKCVFNFLLLLFVFAFGGKEGRKKDGF